MKFVFGSVSFLKNVLFFFTFLSTYVSTKHSYNSKDFEIKIYNIVLNIVSKFNDCELLYFTESSNLNFFQFSTLNVKSAGSHILTGVEKNITLRRHNDIHRYTWPHCCLAIMVLTQFNPGIESWLVKTLLPRFAPVIRKDLDYFVFISKSEAVLDQILQNDTFGMKIRFKIGLFIGSNSTVQSKTLNFYGGRNGQAQLLSTSHLLENITSVSELFPDMTSQFNGKCFRFSIPKVAFRFEIRLAPDGNYHPVRGFYKWYFQEATRKFNFTCKMFYSSYGGGTGKQLENGTWVGALGDVLYGKADFSTMIGLVYSRHEYIGWSSALSYEWMVFITPSPKKFYSAKAIVKPFTPFLWIMFVVSLAVTGVMFKTVEQFTSCKSDWNFMETFCYIYATLLEQDQTGKLKRCSSVRVLASFWFLFAMVTATAYRGKLVSIIAFPVTTWIPETFAELANSDFKVALNLVGKAGAAFAWVASSPNPVIRKLATRVDYIKEGEKCLERAMYENLGCILWKGIADYVLVKNLTDRYGRVPLEESKETAMFIKDGFNFEKRAIFGHIFDKSIQSAVQMGLSIKWFQMDQNVVKKERKEWIQKENVKEVVFDEFINNGPKRLVLSQFIGIFVVCLIGLVVSTMQFVRELLYGLGCCGILSSIGFNLKDIIWWKT